MINNKGELTIHIEFETFDDLVEQLKQTSEQINYIINCSPVKDCSSSLKINEDGSISAEVKKD